MGQKEKKWDPAKLHMDSQVVHGLCRSGESTGAVSVPIYQSAAFCRPGLGQSTGYDYSREKNPTRDAVQQAVNALEAGAGALAFSSGMAAIAAVGHLFRPGDHLLVSDDLYGGTYRLFEEMFVDLGIRVDHVDTSRPDGLEQALREDTRGVFVETPTNPTMEVTDLDRTARFCREHNLRLIVDNTFLTPVFQRPLVHGADLVIHSASKYLGGHNDTIAGFVVAADKADADRLAFVQKTVGTGLAPFDSWLILRGLKTLALRMERHEANAQTVARWLREHPAVERVYYVGLPDHPGFEISRRQTGGFGGMVSFRLHDPALVPRVLERVRMILFAESLGGTETLITYPRVQTHGDMPEDLLDRLGIDERLLRLSVGIERVCDIIGDLEQALEEG